MRNPGNEVVRLPARTEKIRRGKQADEREAEEFGVRNDRGGTGETVAYPPLVITTACNKSVSEIIRHFKKLHFLYLQTVLTKLIKQPSPASYRV